MKKQLGIAAFELLVVLVVAGMVLYNILFPLYMNDLAMKELRSNPTKPASADDIRLVDSFKAKPQPMLTPSGKYYATGAMDGKEYEITIVFGADQTLTKETIFLEKYRFYGSAKYHFDGSVLVYSEIIGDRFLFPEIGEAVSIPSENMIITHSALSSISLKSPALIEQEKREAVAAQKELLDSISIFDLSSDLAVEKLTGNNFFIRGITLLIVFILLISAYKFYQQRKREC